MNDISLPILIKTLLAQHGLLTSAELQSATGKSQATLSRALKQLLPQVQALGRGRRTVYGWTREIMGHAGQQPIYLTDENGYSSQWGRLTFVEGERLHVQTPDINTTSQGDLPWFLEAMRPQGFLGRLRGQSIGFADANPDNWSLEQTLYAILAFEHDGPGALTLGQETGELLPEAPLDLEQRAQHYDRLASNVTQTLPAGSSAGGEQPKFLVHLDTPTGYDRLVVKFTPPRGTPFGERWHDLLHTELIALQTLAKHGFSTAKTRIVQSSQRTYLESVRFDRIGQNGKRHIVALAPIHKAFVGSSRQNWAVSCDKLAELGHLPHQDAQTVHVLLYFGRLIGNTDMHFGNLSLAVNDMTRLANPKFSLAPCYDMLTMAYKPSEFKDELGYTALEVPRQPPGADASWQQALAMAMAKEFWETLGETEAVSTGLRNAAQNQYKTLLIS
jgi:HipA-like C-terminal domain